MPVSALWYGKAFEGQYGTSGDRQVDILTDTIQTSLHTVTYVPDQDAHVFMSPSVTNEVAAAGGYAAGGYVHASGKSATFNTGTNDFSLDLSDAVWTGVSFTTRIAVTYANTPGAATTDPVLWHVNFGADQTVATGNFSIIWDALGAAKIAVSAV